MEKLSMCRVCLGEEVRLLPIVGTHLQDMYESLVLMPLESTDGRPVLACYICCARLKNCYELRKSCLQSEEMFTQMLNSNEPEQVSIQLQGINNKKKLVIDNVVHLSVGHALDMSADNVGVEALKIEVKLEPDDGEDIDEAAQKENSVFDNAQSADDFKCIVKEERTGDRTSDPTPKESTIHGHWNPEALPTSNPKDHELVQDTLQAVHKLTAVDVTAVNNTNEVTFTVADDSKERPTSVPRSECVQCMCSTCQQCYSSKCELERHIRVCSDLCKTDLSRENSTSTHTAQGPHQSTVCNKSFICMDSLTRHPRTNASKKPYHCDLCDKRFSLKSLLKGHIRTHTGEKPYQCELCNKRFSLEGNLKQHIRTHSGDKPYQCDICKKLFLLNSNLSKHMRTHTGEKPHQCDLCDKRYSLKSHLSNHLRSHTGEKPYHCDLCNKRFSVQSHVKQHMLTHTGEKPYHCGICKKQFSQKGNLIGHMRTHSGEKLFHCDICKSSFTTKKNVICHIRTHTGEKPYQCYICKKQYAKKHTLKCHIRTHTGDKPYECHTCKKKFSQTGPLNRHMRLNRCKKP